MDDLNSRRIRGLMSAGVSFDEHFRRSLRVELLWVTDDALALVAAHPHGVVRLEPHLRVVESRSASR